MTGVTLSDVNAVSTSILAIFTIVLAVAALRANRNTVRAVAAAELDAREAVKARIDQQAPRVTIVAREASAGTWQPESAPRELELDQALADSSAPVGIFGWFILRNDGRSTAVVEVPARCSVQFTLGTNLGDVKHAPSAAPTQHPIEPGQAVMVLAFATRPLAEWRAQARLDRDSRTPVRLRVLVDDTFRDGIRDTTTLAFYGVPVRMSGTAAMTGLEEPPWLVVERTVRTYPNLDISRRPATS